jgi:hypothetical protein
MSRSTHSYEYAPRLMTHFDLAIYVRRSEGWLKEKLNELFDQGFPKPDCLFDRHGLFDRDAVDAWLDRRSGLFGAPRIQAPVQPTVTRDDLLKRIENAEL